MQPIAPLMHLITAVLIIVCFARTVGSSFSSHAASLQADQRHSREIDVEVAHWATQIKSSDQEERREAALRLTHLDGSAALSALTSALTDPMPGVRAIVVACLGERSDTSIVPLIAARLASDKDAFVRKSAAYALAKFAGDARTSSLISALKDKDLEVRGAAAVSLGDHSDASAIGALASALSDKSAFVRAQSARALGVNGRAAVQTVSALIGLLDADPDIDVKRQAATAVGLIGDRSALPALERAGRDGDVYLAQAARDAIAMIKGRSEV